MISKKDFLEKIDAVTRLMEVGNYYIAAKTLLDIGLHEDVVMSTLSEWKKNGVPTQQEFSETYQKVIAQEYEFRFKELREEERPDVNISKSKLDNLSKTLEENIDVLDMIKKL